MTLIPLHSAPAPLVERLAAFGDRRALATAERTLSYAELAAAVDAFARRLGSTRRLVLLSAGNDLESVIAYLGARAGGHPAILLHAEAPVEAIVAAYDPDVVVRGDRVHERRAGTAHTLHPDLALLLSTSGSSGSPKLVRLSADNLDSNAASIADYLAIRQTDLAATTLPLAYCYGLSVLNSHLLRGAGVLLTELSVVDRCFWELFRDHGATSFAGVPYTFDLLDRVGFDELDLPTLRYVTQAGGRLAPAQVERYAALGQRRGFDLFVMYGQTEATARIAYLPPDLALRHPSAIGIAVPGGRLELDPLPDEPGLGELVYSGPNVMLGYAHRPEDLALGRVVTELRTGDVGRRTETGLVEVVGRRDRITKLFGLRLDLDRAEQVLADAGLDALCTARDGRLVVGLPRATPAQVERVRRTVRRSLGLPAGAVVVPALDSLPRLAGGKPDYPALAAAAPVRAPAVPEPDLCAEFALVLGRAEVREQDTFVSLGGDSLSYVEMSVRLEAALGHLPRDWHVTPIGRLEPARPRRRGWRTVETNVLLRALAIVLVVGTHGNLFAVTGGAHLLLGIVGFNFARFQLTGAPTAVRARRAAGALARIVVPSVLWIGAVAAAVGTYPWATVALVNGFAGPRSWAEPEWHFWFIEVVVWTTLATAALTAVPVVHRLERRWPFWFPVALAGLGLLTRYDLVVLRGGDEIHRAGVLFWLFALGWAAARATRPGHRWLLSALVVASVPGFFGDPAREAVVTVGLLLLVWVSQLRVPTPVAKVTGVLAAASLYVYLSHWQVYPHLEDDVPLLAVLASLAVGCALWCVVSRTSAWLSRGVARPSGTPTPEAR